MLNFLVFFLVFGIAGALAAWYFLNLLSEKKLIQKSLDYRVVSVSLYKSGQGEKRDWKSELASSEQLFSALASFGAPVVMEFAVHNFGEDVHLYFSVAEQSVDSLIQQIQAFWSGAEIDLVEDYNIFNPQGTSLAAVLKQEKEAILPIKTFENLSDDFLLPILTIFSSLSKEGDGIALQVIFKKASSSITKGFKKTADELQKGSSLKEAIAKSNKDQISKIIDTFKESFKNTEKPEESKKEKDKPSDSDLIEGVALKNSRQLLEVNIRLVSSCPNNQKAQALINQIQSVLPQVANAKGNSLSLKQLKFKEEEKEIFDFSFRNFREKNKIILSTQELATLVHLPTAQILETTKIRRTQSRTAPPPLELSPTGLLLGKSSYRGQEKDVRMLEDDRFRHMYVIGMTGTGKTSFLKHLIKQDIENGEGLAFIDPHGNDARDILGLIPPSRWKDVIYFNPADTQFPIGYNLLEYDRSQPEQKTFIANELLEIIGKIYNLAEVGGPMFEQYFKNALFLLLNDPIIKPTLLDVPRVFSDRTYRNELLARCPDPVVVHFWQKEAEKASGDFSLGNVATWVLSKLNPFIANDYIKPIIAQEQSTFSIKDIMENRKIFIINLSKGLIGETNAFFLGMLLTGKIFMNAMSRTGQDVSKLANFFLYIDEFQNVTTKTITNILSEARKFKLSMTIAHQYIGQLGDDVRKAVFGNVGTAVAFRIGPEDANAMKIFFEPTFTEQDLVNIENFNAYTKLMIRGKMSQAFNFAIMPPNKPSEDSRNQIIDLSRKNYSPRSKDDILKEINDKYFVKPETKTEPPKTYEPTF